MSSILIEFTQLANQVLEIAEFPQQDIPKHTARLLSLSFDKTFLDISDKLTKDEKEFLQKELLESSSKEIAVHALSKKINPNDYMRALINDLRQTLVGLIKAGMEDASGVKKDQLKDVLKYVSVWDPQL